MIKNVVQNRAFVKELAQRTYNNQAPVHELLHEMDQVIYDFLSHLNGSESVEVKITPHIAIENYQRKETRRVINGQEIFVPAKWYTRARFSGLLKHIEPDDMEEQMLDDEWSKLDVDTKAMLLQNYLDNV